MRLVVVPLVLALLGPGCADDPGPEPLGDAPDFELTAQTGRSFSSAALGGRPWVASFVFTRCQGICPALSARMARLQRALSEEGRDDVRLVSFSVDPEHDRPPVLAEYAARHGADPERWVFLTGERDAIWRLSRDGFKLAVGESPGDADEPLFHSDRFVLVDGEGRIRGYYEALTNAGFEALRMDLGRLGSG